MKRRAWRRAITVMLAALLTMMSMYAAAQAGKMDALEEQINAAYERAFYESADLLTRIENDLHKLAASAGSALSQTLLREIAADAAAAQSSLTLLPASLSSITQALKFVNQAGDYAAVTSERLAEGGALSEDDRALILTLRDSAAALNALMSEVLSGIERGEHPLRAAAGKPLPALEDVTLEDSAVDFPVLLYDGPFSDGRGEKTLRALTGEAITADEALGKARRFIGEERIHALWLTGEGEVPVPSYEISAYTDEGLTSLAVTRQGGEVIYMMTDAAPTEALFDASALIEQATRFLKERGYPDGLTAFFSEFDGFLTINWVPLVEGVLLYPDLIKIELSMESGEVVGLESLNYLTNHTQRTLPAPALSEIEARSRLSAALQSDVGRLCLIPQNDTERLCYEFAATLDEERYLIYIDALTGEEALIYRLIEDEHGQLTA